MLCSICICFLFLSEHDIRLVCNHGLDYGGALMRETTTIIRIHGTTLVHYNIAWRDTRTILHEIFLVWYSSTILAVPRNRVIQSFRNKRKAVRVRCCSSAKLYPGPRRERRRPNGVHGEYRHYTYELYGERQPGLVLPVYIDTHCAADVMSSR